MTEILAITLILISALLLRTFVNYLLNRLSIFPNDPESRSNGIEDVLDWLKRRREKSRESKTTEE